MKNSFSLQQRVLLWLACSAIFFEAFDVSIVNLALPLIAADLHIPVAAAQWVQTIYLLSFGGCLLLGGRLCDYAGSKKVFLTGMAIFGLASVLASVSHQLWLLLPARAGQGIGAALAMPGGISLLSRHFKEETQPFFERGIYSSPLAIKGLLAFFLLGVSFLSFVAIATLALFEVMGWGIQPAGWLLFPYSIGSALVSRLVLPRLFKKAGVVNTGLFAFLCLLAGAVLLAVGIYTHGLPWYLAAMLLVNSIAIAIGYPALTILSLTGVAPDKQGIAAGLQTAINTIGSGIGLSVTGLCLRAFSRHAMDTSLICACGVVAIGCGLAIVQLLTRKRTGEQSQTGLR